MSTATDIYTQVVGMSLTNAAQLIVSICALYLLWQRRTERRSKSERGKKVLLPSPRRLLPNWFGMISGHTLLIKSGEIVEKLEGWADEFEGDYEISLLGVRVIVTHNVTEIRRLLTLRPAHFKRGLTANQIQWSATEVGYSPCMFFEEGKSWGRSRRIIAPALNAQNVAEMVPSISEVVGRLCAKWSRQAAAGEAIDGKDDMTNLTHDVLSRAALDREAGALEATPSTPCITLDTVNSLSFAYIRITMDPLLKLAWICIRPLLSWAREAKRSRAILEAIVLKMIAQKRHELNTRNSGQAHPGELNAALSRPSSCDGKVLEKIVAAGASDVENDGLEKCPMNGGSAKALHDRKAISDSQMVREIMNLFLAGTDTTSKSMSWTLYYLVKHPETHARCREEALRVAPETNGLVVNKEQHAQLTFCTAVFKETIRLRSVAPVQFHYAANAHEMDNGTKVEKGDGVVVLTRYATTREKNFTRAKEFVPARWIESEREEALLGKAAGNGHGTVHHCEDAFVAFGHGPRYCPGQYMALAEAAMIVAAVCARFDLSFGPGQPDPPREITDFTLGPESIILKAKPV